mmetsp:Transcript_102872/g.187843  ORF Transcript_102872/g.187843 Transcript_102872/m.187843 type:complete len:244 (-) Transcript_102872:924-1655(-)
MWTQCVSNLNLALQDLVAPHNRVRLPLELLGHPSELAILKVLNFLGSLNLHLLNFVLTIFDGLNQLCPKNVVLSDEVVAHGLHVAACFLLLAEIFANVSSATVGSLGLVLPMDHLLPEECLRHGSFIQLCLQVLALSLQPLDLQASVHENHLGFSERGKQPALFLSDLCQLIAQVGKLFCHDSLVLLKLRDLVGQHGLLLRQDQDLRLLALGCALCPLQVFHRLLVSLHHLLPLLPEVVTLLD